MKTVIEIDSHKITHWYLLKIFHSLRLSSALKELDDVKGEKVALEARVSELKKRG